MDEYITQLKLYILRKNQEESKDPDSLLDFLWKNYQLKNPLDDQQVKAAEETLRPFYESLPFEDANAHFNVISELCVAYEHKAFIDGLRVGVQLITEMLE